MAQRKVNSIKLLLVRLEPFKSEQLKTGRSRVTQGQNSLERPSYPVSTQQRLWHGFNIMVVNFGFNFLIVKSILLELGQLF